MCKAGQWNPINKVSCMLNCLKIDKGKKARPGAIGREVGEESFGDRERIQLRRRKEDFEERNFKGKCTFLIHKTIASSISATLNPYTFSSEWIIREVRVETGLKGR